MTSGSGSAGRSGCRRVAVGQQRRATRRLGVVADPLRSKRQGSHTPKEALVRLVRPRDRPMALPAVTTQRVEPSVITDARERVRMQITVGRERLLGHHGPRERGCRVLPGDVFRVIAASLQGSGGVGRKKRGGRAAQQVVKTHNPMMASLPRRWATGPSAVRQRWLQDKSATTESSPASIPKPRSLEALCTLCGQEARIGRCWECCQRRQGRAECPQPAHVAADGTPADCRHAGRAGRRHTFPGGDGGGPPGLALVHDTRASTYAEGSACSWVGTSMVNACG